MFESIKDGVLNEAANLKFMLSEFEALAIRYKDYKKVNPSKLPFREAETDFEKRICHKAKLKTIGFCSLILLVVVAILVLVIMKPDTLIGNKIMGYSIIALMALVPLLIIVSTCVSKNNVCLSKVITTSVKMTSSSNGHSSRKYVVSVHIDYPERLMASNIDISRNLYHELSENDDVLVVKVPFISAFKVD